MYESYFKEVKGDEQLAKLLKLLNNFKHAEVTIEYNNGQRQAIVNLTEPIYYKDGVPHRREMSFTIYIEDDNIFITHVYDDKIHMLIKLKYYEGYIDTISYYLSNFLHSAKNLKEIYEREDEDRDEDEEE